MAARKDFNSRPCERGFEPDSETEQEGRIFQFTPLREGLHNYGAGGVCMANFNSRPCERGFFIFFELSHIKYISIHAPARGASVLLTASFCALLSISIHAPARGASHSSWVGNWTMEFQFTPLREGLLRYPTDTNLLSYFNSRPCERGFTICSAQSSHGSKFQFTPLREGLRSIPYTSFLRNAISIHAPARGASLS